MRGTGCGCPICPGADMEDNDAVDDAGSSLFNFACTGIPAIVRSALATIAVLASTSEAKDTNQRFVLR